MLFKLALRNVIRDKDRSKLSIMMVFVATQILVSALGQIGGIKQVLIDSMTDTLTGHVMIKPKLAPKDFFEPSSAKMLELIKPEDAQDLLAKVSSLESVEAAAPRIRFGSLIGNDDRSVPAMVMAVNPVLESKVCPDLKNVVAELALPSSSIISPYLAKKMDIKQGEELLIFSDTPNGSFNAQVYNIKGSAEAPLLMDEFMNSLFMVSLDSARELLYLDDNAATELVVRLTPQFESDITSVVAQINEMMTPEQKDYLQVYRYDEVAKPVSNISGIAAAVGGIQVGVIMLVMLVIILILTKMTLHERSFEIGTLVAIGMTPVRLAGLFLSEVMMKVGTGFVAGFLMGTLLLVGIQQFGGISASTQIEQYLYGGKVLYPVIDFGNMVLAFMIIAGTVIVVTLGTFLRVSKQDAVTLLSGRN